MRMARKYRVCSHVGGVRKKLARMLVKVLADEGIQARCDPKNLWPAQGYWRQVEQDVMSWEGQLEIFVHGKWSTRSLGSWDRMTSCVRGFTISPDGFGFEINAIQELAPSQRFGK